MSEGGVEAVFDGLEVEIPSSAVQGLKNYAISVMKVMQEADREHAYCWTHAAIAMDELQPVIWWGGSVEDLGDTSTALLVVALEPDDEQPPQGGTE